MRTPIRATIAMSYEHQVHFTHGVFNTNNPLLAEILSAQRSGHIPKVMMVVDENLVAARPGLLEVIANYFSSRDTQFRMCAPVLISGGETAKNQPAALESIYSSIERQGLCRHSYVIAVGGGALLDVAGFAATTAHRGMRHVRIPTTVLSQDDGGVGIKNGVNAFGKKNFIGAFSPPLAVINDFEMLASLPVREKRAGYIEAIKVASIRDRTFFEFIEKNSVRLRDFEPAILEELIYRCAEAHVRHIANGGDPFELGSARPLDFGHWSAHKLEQLSEFKIHHGEAVAVGIALDVTYARHAGFLDPASAERIISLIEALGFEIYTDVLARQDSRGELEVLNGIEEFREHLGGTLAITLLKEIGHGFEINSMDKERIRESIQSLSQRGGRKT